MLQPWAHSNSYVVTSSATDLGGNIQTTVVISSFTYDTGVPTATLTMAAYINAGVATIDGTATDSPAGVHTLQLAVSSGNGVGSSWLTGIGGTFTRAAQGSLESMADV